MDVVPAWKTTMTEGVVSVMTEITEQVVSVAVEVTAAPMVGTVGILEVTEVAAVAMSDGIAGRSFLLDYCNAMAASEILEGRPIPDGRTRVRAGRGMHACVASLCLSTYVSCLSVSVCLCLSVCLSFFLSWPLNA